MAVPNQVVQCDQWCAEGAGNGENGATMPMAGGHPTFMGGHPTCEI